MTVDPFFNIELLNTINEVTGPGGVATTDLLGTTIDYAKALSLLATMITFSIRAYGMMVGDKRLEIMPLFRPFALILVIINFNIFSQVVAYPFSQWNSSMQDAFTSEDAVMEAKYTARTAAIDSLIDAISTAYATALTSQQAASSSDENSSWFSEAANEAFGPILISINSFLYKADNKIHFAILAGMEYIMMGCLKFICYALFMVSNFFEAVLIVLGPFAFGMSVFNGFHETYIAWIARFISVVFYQGIGWLILDLCLIICTAAIDHDVTKIDYLINLASTDPNSAELNLVFGNPIGSLDLLFGIVAVGAAITLLTVPIISTWIVSTSGITPVVSKLGSTASGMAMGGVKSVMGAL